MIVRSRAPLRLGIAGGGTDLSPYCDQFGGCVLNATINMYAHVHLNDEVEGKFVTFEAKDLGVVDKLDLTQSQSISGPLVLHRAVYLRIMNQFNGGDLIPLNITTHADAPPGSGLGSSSTMVVALIQSLKEYLKLPLGEYDIARLAFEIERVDCKLSGGKQDQYAATFGGFNFMEFMDEGRVIVNPLRVRRHIISELESSIILYYTGKSRSSARIINDQTAAISDVSDDKLEAMHNVKRSCYKIKEDLLKSDIPLVASEFRESWEYKKATSRLIANSEISAIEQKVLSAGALSLKLSGAGGGGFMMIFVVPEQKPDVVRSLHGFDGRCYDFSFVDGGSFSWTI